jgi:serine/threonine protein kinase
VSGGLYRIKGVLGSGATAVVCLAEPHDRPQQLVALKVLHQDLVQDLSALNRIRDEGRMLTGLRHPHILQVHQLHDYDGRPVIEMEFVRGAPLDEVMRKFPKGLPGGAALSVGTKIAVALDAAYYSRQGPNRDPMRIIHRDLKPANVLMSTSGAVKVADFGLAKARFEGRESKTLSGVVGTREFMPPEVLIEGEYSSAVDVYSLAMTMFKMLTGKVLVVSRKKGGHQESVIKYLGYLKPEGLPDIVLSRLRDLLASMLQYAPEKRPELCNVAGELQRLLMHPSVDPDVGSFAQKNVLAIVQGRPNIPAMQHVAWPDICFLETQPPTVHPPLSVTEAEAEVRKIMSQPGWDVRLADLHRVMERAEVPVTRPFLEVLDKQITPWWQVWSKPSTPAQMEVALILLSDKPIDAAVTAAEKLLKHESERVGNAARFLVQVASGDDDGDFPPDADSDADSYITYADSYIDSSIEYDDDTDA